MIVRHAMSELLNRSAGSQNWGSPPTVAPLGVGVNSIPGRLVELNSMGGKLGAVAGYTLRAW